MVGRIPSETNYDQFEADYAASGLDLPDWMGVIRACPRIPKAMDYAALPLTWRNQFFQYMDQWEQLGPQNATRVAACPDPLTPVDATRNPDMTENEARQYWAYKVLHALWVEKERKFPWRLGDYYDHELAQLVDGREIFYRSPSGTPGIGGDPTFDPTGTNNPGVYAQLYGYIDDPAFVWSVYGNDAGGTLNGVSLEKPWDAIAYLLLNQFRTMKHTSGVGGGEPERCIHAEDFEDLSLNGNAGANPNTQRRFDRCYSMARIFSAIMRNLNIPANGELVRVFLSGANDVGPHATIRLWLEHRCHVTIHADNIGANGWWYSTGESILTDYKQRIPLKLWSPFDFTQTPYLTYEPTWQLYVDGTIDGPAMAGHIRRTGTGEAGGGPRSDTEAGVGWITPAIIDNYVANGWANVLANQFSRIHTAPAWQDALRARLIQITGVDNP